MNQLGIKETKELLVFTSRLANAIDKTLADGKVTVTDAVYIFDPLSAAKDGIDGIGQVDNEIADLSEQEAVELVELFALELDLSNNLAESLAEEGLALGVAIVNFVNKVRAARSN